jgi:hypothetical protein
MVQPNWAQMPWRKSQRSNSATGCVECAQFRDVVGLRDSRDRGGPVLVFDCWAWQMFIAAVKRGEFDRRSPSTEP